MSYERDRDRDTRGVGAIAALDKGNRARYQQRVARARHLERLDRKLAQYTYRPGGGMGALGMINMGAMGVGQRQSGGAGDPRHQDPTRPPTMPGGGGPGMTPPAPRPPWFPTRLYGGAGSMLQQPLTSTPPARWPTVRVPAGAITTMQPMQPGMIVDPVRPPSGTVGTIGTVSGGGVPVVNGGSSGGGGGGYSTTPPAVYPGMETPQIPDVPDDVAAPSGLDIKKIAMIGGAAVAVWYLFFRKKPSSSGGAP